MSKFDFGEEAQLTNEQFADELARLTTLTTTQIEQLFPRKVDKKRFTQLMRIASASASRNARIAAVKQNFDAFGGAIMKLLELLT